MKCDWCGNEFEPTRKDARFCPGTECKDKFFLRERQEAIAAFRAQQDERQRA